MARSFAQVLIIALASAATLAMSTGYAATLESVQADRLLVVDCLLPGQVRKLGGAMTYLSARRAIKTTAQDCEIRGGEYVAYDRSNYATALKVWLPLAESGDPAAQTLVGEIYEKGLGLAPDYGAAAHWYRKAAESGNSRAQINLGFLYEKGLGVPKDPATALSWYRRASGLEGAVALDDGTSNANREVQKLRKELDDAHRQLEKLKRDLEQHKQSANTQELKLSQSQQELANLQASGSGDRKLVQKLEAQIKQQQAEYEKQRQVIAKLEQDRERYRTQLASLENKQIPLSQEGKEVAIAPPAIQIIDPPTLLTRSVPQVKVRSGLTSREIVGKVTAPAGLLSFMVNDKTEEIDNNGLFRVQVPISPQTTPVQLVAVDRQGKRAAIEFSFVPEKTPVAAPMVPSLPAVDFGNYHALIIGNEKYKRLPVLDTPVNDAKAVAELLASKYGFKTTVLLNADRYEILSALNKLREKLTEKDNLLLYYAGHGELDKVNQRGHWLPIDAEPDSTANWISNIAITDILNAMAVKHVLVVADSCYSGALTRSSLTRLDAGMTDEAKLNWFKVMAKTRSRTVLTSGGLKPVLDGGGGKHSIFAKAFLEVLRSNHLVVEGQSLYREISARVAFDAIRFKAEQVPEYAPIKFGGHESGDFLFVPTTNSGVTQASAAYSRYSHIAASY